MGVPEQPLPRRGVLHSEARRRGRGRRGVGHGGVRRGAEEVLPAPARRADLHRGQQVLSSLQGPLLIPRQLVPRASLSTEKPSAQETRISLKYHTKYFHIKSIIFYKILPEINGLFV